MSKNNKSNKPVTTQEVEEIKEEISTEEVSHVDEVKEEEKVSAPIAEPEKDPEPAKEPVVEPVIKNEAKPPNPPTATVEPVDNLKVGDMVMLKDSTTSTVTGTIIPVFAFKNLYKVEKILTDRIIIAAGTLKFPVKASDVNNVKK